MATNLTYKPFGNKAILIEWEAKIDEKILNQIIQFKEKIATQKAEMYADFIIAYNSLTIVYQEPVSNFWREVNRLQSIHVSDFEGKQKERFVFEIPVCYDVEFGQDLQEMAWQLNLSVNSLIQLHSEKLYTVFFIGFLPGFLYLGGLHKKLYVDRRSNPRLQVPKGSVGIGGKQTGIYPSNSAGGWNIIGKTPINFFDVNKTNPCFVKPGDRIQFAPISKKKYDQIAQEILVDKFILHKTPFHD